MSVAEALGLMFSFGVFIISLLNFILKVSLRHNKKRRR